MRLATFLPPGAEHPSRARCATARPIAFARRRAPCSTASRSGRRHARRRRALAARRRALLAPVPRPRAIFGIGLNYAEHAAETGAGAARGADRLHEGADRLDRALGGPVRCPPVVRRLDYEGELGDRGGRGRRGRRLRGGRRRQRARPPAPRAAVDARQGRRHVLPVGPVDHHRRRGPAPRGPAPAHLGQRRAAPGLEHLGPHLRRRGAAALPARDLHAGARRPDPHRHPAGRRHGARPARASWPRATWCASRSSRWAAIEHAVA